MSSVRSTGTATNGIGTGIVSGTDIVTGTATATGTAIVNGADIGIAGTPGVMAAVSWFAVDERLDTNGSSGVLPGLPPFRVGTVPAPSGDADRPFGP